MKFTRILTADEIERLGNDPQRVLNGIIEEGIRQLKGGVTKRILSIMDTMTPMTARQVMEAHNAVHGENPITLEYSRYVLSAMAKLNVIRRKSRGWYIR